MSSRSPRLSLLIYILCIVFPDPTLQPWYLAAARSLLFASLFVELHYCTRATSTTLDGATRHGILRNAASARTPAVGDTAVFEYSYATVHSMLY